MNQKHVTPVDYNEKKGVGTQLIEKEISLLFPDKKGARLDYDTTRKKSSFKDLNMLGKE